MRRQMQIRVHRGRIQFAAMHLAQRTPRRTQPSLMPVECRNAVSLSHVRERNALVGIFRINVDGQRFPAKIDRAFHDAAGDLVDGRRSARRLHIFVEQLVGGRSSVHPRFLCCLRSGL